MPTMAGRSPARPPLDHLAPQPSLGRRSPPGRVCLLCARGALQSPSSPVVHRMKQLLAWCFRYTEETHHHLKAIKRLITETKIPSAEEQKLHENRIKPEQKHEGEGRSHCSPVQSAQATYTFW